MTLPFASVVPISTITLLLSGWIVHHFASPTVSIFIRILVTVSFWLGFGGIALLPIDLQLTTVFEEGDEGATKPNETYTLWMVMYLSTFVLAFIVLPLCREALLSGQFTVSTRLRAGCRKAVKTYALLSCLGLIGVISLGVKLKDWNVIPVVIALGNTYGLLLVSLLLGYGLVDFPRHMWRKSEPVTELRRRRIMAGNADEAVFEAVWELQDCEALIDDVASKVSDSEGEGGTQFDTHYYNSLDKLLTHRNVSEILGKDLQRRRTTGSGRRHSETDDKEEIVPSPSLDYLARLNARLGHAQADVVSAEQRWNELVVKAALYENLAEGTVPLPTVFQTVPSDSILTKLSRLFSTLGKRLEYLWLTQLRRPFLRFFATLTAGLSVMVLWSEATLALPINLSPFALILSLVDNSDGKSSKGFLFQIAAFVPFLYIAICVYSSLFKVSVFGRYRLRGNKQSTSVACAFNAQYLVRLQFPLAYNYLLMIKYDVNNTNCAFSHVMSNMSTVPFFGANFSLYAPLLIILLCLFTMFNGYARLLLALGIEHEDAVLLENVETLDEKANEGITLLRRHHERQNPAKLLSQQGISGSLVRLNSSGDVSNIV